MHWGEVLDKKLAALPAGAAAVWAAVSVLRLRSRPGSSWLHHRPRIRQRPWTLPGLSFPCGCSEIFYADRPVTRGSRSSPQIGLSVAMTARMNMAGTS